MEVIVLPKRQDRSKQPVKKTTDFSGSEYHRKHAGHVPDYGGNIQDPAVNQDEAEK